MPKKVSAKRGYMTKKEVYSKLDGLKTGYGKAQYLDKILSKKGLLAPETYKAVQEVANEMYGKASIYAIGERRFRDAGKFVEKIKDKKLADEMYRKVAEEALKGKEGLGYSREFAEKIKDKKLADEVYRNAAVKAVAEGRFGVAIEFAEKAGNKKLVDDVYRKVAVGVARKGRFGDAGEFAKKSEGYLKQKYPEILADIYEETGKVIKAKDLRKRLEAKKKKKIRD